MIIPMVNSNGTFSNIAPPIVEIRRSRLIRTGVTEQQNTVNNSIDLIQTNAQFSVRGVSVNDTAAGTGVRTITVYYLDQDFNGPFTESFTLNGITVVPSAATNFCYLDNVVVTTCGSGFNTSVTCGYVVYADATGLGLSLCNVTASNTELVSRGFASHWVPKGVTCWITGFGCSCAGSPASSTLATTGGLVSLRYYPVSMTDPANFAFTLGVNPSYLLDRVHIIGLKDPMTVTYNSPIRIDGPAKVWMTTTPETVTTSVYESYFTYFETTTPG